MCEILTTALMVGGQVASSASANKQAGKIDAYNAATFEASERYRQKLDRYNNEVFKQDVDYFNQLLDYQQSEFGRQAVSFDTSKTAISKDYVSQVGQLLTRMTEEYVASSLMGEDAVRAGRRGRSSTAVASAEMGIEGNTVDAVVNSVRRSVGESLTAYQIQQRSVIQQLQFESLGLSARADSEIANIPLQSFSPLAAPNPPTPSQPGTAPIGAPRVGIGETLGKVGGIVGQGISDYYKGRNMTMPTKVIDALLLRPGTIVK